LENIPASHPFIIIAHRLTCFSKKHMHKYASAVIGQGGEGVILRKPNSLYENGKSRQLLKFKDMIDVEGHVVGIDGFKVTCKLTNGEIISATKKPRQQLEIGNVVSFSVVKNTANTVYSIHRVRYDITWDELVQNSYLFNL